MTRNDYFSTRLREPEEYEDTHNERLLRLLSEGYTVAHKMAFGYGEPSEDSKGALAKVFLEVYEILVEDVE